MTNVSLSNVSLDKAYRLLNHGPTVLVTSAHGEQINIMAAAWNMPLDFQPPKIAIVIDKKTYTRELIEASGSFVINVPCRAQAAMVVQVGSSSGRELLGKEADNKFAAFDLPTLPATKIDAPLLAGCAEVVAAHADNRVFTDGHWHFEGHDNLRTIHHIAGGNFMAIGEAFKA